MTLYSKRQIGRQIDRSQRMYVNIINYTRLDVKNIFTEVIMNLHYIFVIIKCKSYCKIKT